MEELLRFGGVRALSGVVSMVHVLLEAFETTL
jgi:hypothetical protein